KEMRAELQFSTIFISHDLAVAAEIADRIATMYAGNIVEIGPVDEVFYHPRHAYTLSLLNAAPRLSHTKTELESIPGNPPDLIHPPSGCKFHPRCSFATEICATTMPPLETRQANHVASHAVACHHSDQVMQAVRHA
ncbi:MAG: oligopeptide/dipeptide ABC transporter ATP-binding protein, partial [Chloroflexota bacterium]